MSKTFQEALIYCIIGISALFFMAYSVHMVVGGLVSTEAEYGLMAVVCVAGVAAMGYMAWDVVRRRKGGTNGDEAPRR